MKKVLNSIGKYFKGVKKEIGRIRWTTGKELVKYSLRIYLKHFSIF